MNKWKKIPKAETCFICGPKNEYGLNLTFEIKGDEVRTFWTPQVEHCGYPGIAHGGIISAVLDEIMGWTGWERYRKYYLTCEASIRFKSPVFAGIEHEVRARLLKTGSRLYMAEGEIRSPDGEIVATGTAKYFVIEKDDLPKRR